MAGTYPLGSGANSNHNDCSQCVLLFEDEENGGGHKRTYFQVQGTMDISSVPDANRPVESKGVINGLRLTEVTIDAQSFTSTPVPNGRCYDVSGITWDHTKGGGEPACEDGGVEYGGDCSTCAQKESEPNACCGQEWANCQGNTSCLGLLNCRTQCNGDQQCLQNCSNMHSGGISDLNAVVACLYGAGSGGQGKGACSIACQ